MEQFYEITPQSKRFAECMTYWNESDKQAEKVRKFMSNHTGRSGRCLDVLRCRHSSMAEHYRGFCCQKCGYEENADYNASQNIGTKHIDVIIEETLKMQCEPEAPTE